MDIIDLTESNPTRAGFTYPAETVIRALEQEGSLVYEPHPRGLWSARHAVAGYLEGEGVRVDPDRIYLTASTSEAYAYLFKLLADPGDAVLIPRPSYPLMELLAAMEAIHAIPYDLSWTPSAGWHLRKEELEASYTERCRALLVINPNNPTGNFLRRHEWEEITRFCSTHDLAIISDEVFFPYVLPRSRIHDPPVSALALPQQTLVFALGGFSKALGLPQVKLSWIVSNGPAPALREALDRLDVIADTYLSVGTPVQQAANALIAIAGTMQGAIRTRCQTNLDFLSSVFPADGNVQLLRPPAGWYAVLRLPSHFDEGLTACCLLEEKNVLLHPGYFFDFPGGEHLVVSLLPQQDRFEEGIRRTAELLC
ncbi:MAG: pyridoxal phosphate-dependent aminotransferase [Bacteroidota bacterium]|nr:pyridoxal phosphate-dependent aminotransferase [Bacteroidota bacterium]